MAGRNSAGYIGTGGGRLAAALAFSMVVHAAGLPGALTWLDSGFPDVPPREEYLEGELEVEEEERRELRLIEEPPAPEKPRETAKADAPPLPEAPELAHQDFVPPAVDPVDFRAWPRATRNIPRAVARKPGKNRDRHLESTDAAAEPADIPDPVAPAYPEFPPESLLSGLPPGGHSSGKPTTVLGKNQRSSLRKKVYAQTHYPEEAAELEMEGVVVVGFRLDGQGKPHDIHVTKGKDVHDSLRREAQEMVKRGAPYPVPVVRQPLEAFVAVAYLNTSQSPADLIEVIAASGDSRIDARAREIAAQEAALCPEEGWQVAAYPLRAEFEFIPGSPLTDLRLVSYSGDVRFKSVVLERGPRMLAAPGRTGWLRIPIQFKILDP